MTVELAVCCTFVGETSLGLTSISGVDYCHPTINN
jgi:hypothetical protein